MLMRELPRIVCPRFPKSTRRLVTVLLGLGLAVVTTACQTVSTPQPRVASPEAETEMANLGKTPAAEESTAEAPTPPTDRRATLMHINDVYRIGGVDNGREGGLARVRALRAELEKEAPDLLFLHAGDLLFPSMLSRQFLGAQMIDVLNLMNGDRHAFDDRMFATFGNHEFDKEDPEDAAMLDRRIEESAFTWLASNINFQPDVGSKQGVEAWNLMTSKIVESGGLRLGLFSLSTDMVHPAYVTSFDPPEATARRLVRELRRDGAEVVVALTHLALSEDVALLEALGEDGPDLVLGGHEHAWIERRVHGRWILKADAEARSATVVRVSLGADGAPHIEFERRELDATSPVDPAVQQVVAEWTRQHDQEFCFENLELPPGCLDDVFGRTTVRLSGEELDIRRYETNLGNWVADRALAAFEDDGGADIAFINSGSLRLNQDIPSDTDITRRHIEETFQFSSFLRRVRISGDILQQALDHSVKNWTGEGKWLQVAGFAFRHDPKTQTADRLTLLTEEGPRPIRPEDELILVTGTYLVTPSRGQDGYTMLTPDMVLPDDDPPELKGLVVQHLKATRSTGIAPQVEGRICNAERPGPCLAIADER